MPHLNKHDAQRPVLPKAAAFYILQLGADYFKNLNFPVFRNAR
jgi:hypothetical protein